MNLILSYGQVALLAIGLLVSFVLLRRGNHKNLNEPPLVPYKYPIIGHTIDFYKDNENFIKKCKAEYGEIFNLYVFGRIMTVVGKELTPEVFKKHQVFNFDEAVRETFPTAEFIGSKEILINVIAKIVQRNLSGGELELYIERVHRQLISSIDGIIGKGDVLQPPVKSFQFIIAKPIAATLVGEELSNDTELVNSFAYATSDIAPFMSIPPFLSYIHPIIHKKFIVMIFRCLNTPFKARRELIQRKLAPVIEKRLAEMKKLGDSYVAPVDILQRIIEFYRKDRYDVDINVVINCMISTVFASVHTTSMYLTFALQEIVNNPQYYKELLEEQEQIHKTDGNSYYSLKQIAKMEKLDSLIRETLRVDFNNVTFEHKVTSASYTFSNGYQVPKGRIVAIRAKEIQADEEFNAFRHLNGSPASRVERNFIAFGLGKHACPGRFFAINEIKLALHHLLLKYNIRKVGGGKVKPNTFGPYISPSDDGLIFERR